MKYGTHILSWFLFGCLLLAAQPSFAQESPDDKPHIQPRATPTPTPAAKGSQTQKPDEYDRPPFPGDAPGTRPTSKSPDGYDRPSFPGDVSGTNSAGESSSRDSQIDLGAHPAAAEPEPAEEDDSVLKPWDPHKAAKDVEVGQYYLKLKNYR